MAAKSLYKLVISCDDGFRRLFDETQDGEFLDYHIPVENEWGRFTVWGKNLGAFQASNSQSSLEFRLRSAEEVKGIVREILEDVEKACGSVYSIVVGTLPNRRTTPIELLEGTIPSTSELDGLVSSIQSSIALLFRTSMLLRQYRPRGRIPHHRPAPDPTSDVRHIKDKFLKVEETPWLADRLGTLVAERRDYIRYRQEHQLRLAAVHSEYIGEVVSEMETDTIATTYNAQEESSAPISSPKQSEAVLSLQAMSIRTQATSFASAFGIDEDEELRVPELTDLVFNKVPLQYHEPFECPFCRTIQSVGDRPDWKKHVYADLQPFSCTFQGCSSEMFSSRHEWARHEIATHRRQWRCPQCPESIFSQKAHFVEHLSSVHPDIPSTRHSHLLDTCHSPMLYFGHSACPLCQEWQPPADREDNSSEFYRHLGLHMMYLALSAIPLVIEGLEVVEEPSIDNTTSTRSHVSSNSGAVNAREGQATSSAKNADAGPNPIPEIAHDSYFMTRLVKRVKPVNHKFFQPTWLLAPSWQFPPDGPIALGNIIAHPLAPHRSLDRIEPTPSEYIKKVVKTDITGSRSPKSAPGNLWDQFLKAANVVTEAISSISTTDEIDTYRMSAIEEYFLDETMLAEGDMLQKVLTNGRVKEYLRRGSFRLRSVFLISGVMIAKNFSFTRESSMLYRGQSVDNLGIPPEFLQETSDGFEASSDIVFAYRLRRIFYSKGGVGGLESENYTKGALL